METKMNKLMFLIVVLLLFCIYQNIQIQKKLNSNIVLKNHFYKEGFIEGHSAGGSHTNTKKFFLSTLVYSVLNNSIKQKGYVDGYLTAVDESSH